MSTRRPWKFSCRARDCHLRSTGCYETRILAHFCLQARISIVPVLIIGFSMGLAIGGALTGRPRQSRHLRWSVKNLNVAEGQVFDRNRPRPQAFECSPMQGHVVDCFGLHVLTGFVGE